MSGRAPADHRSQTHLEHGRLAPSPSQGTGETMSQTARGPTRCQRGRSEGLVKHGPGWWLRGRLPTGFPEAKHRSVPSCYRKPTTAVTMKSLGGC